MSTKTQVNSKNNKNMNTVNVVKSKGAAPAANIETNYSMVSPKGKVFNFTNIAKFSRRFNLDSGNVSKVLRGERNSHKNWSAVQ